MLCSSADLDAHVGQEFIRRHIEIARRRANAYPSCRIVLRAVAMAEPAAIIALFVRRRVGLWRAPEMRADADQNQPFGLPHCRRTGGGSDLGREPIVVR